MERSSISSTENPQGLYRRPAIDFPRELPKVFCPQISLQSVYLMTPSNGVVEGEGAQIRLWPSGRQLLPYGLRKVARHPLTICMRHVWRFTFVSAS
jgi:hypothetical protein